MTSVSPSRRQRLRTEALAAIKQAARALLAEGGPDAVSLRAIGREVGMTAPAIYRYFPSLDALMAGLCADLYRELHDAVAVARDQIPADRPAERLAAMAHAFRRWVLARPAEFSLMFGEPFPDQGFGASDRGWSEVPDPVGADPVAAGTPFGQAFFTEIEALWRRHRSRTVAPHPIPEKLVDHLAPHLRAYAGHLPAEVIYTFLTGWIRLYGLVAMEVHGHLAWIVTDPEPLFEAEIAAFIHQLTG